MRSVLQGMLGKYTMQMYTVLHALFSLALVALKKKCGVIFVNKDI